MEGGRMMVLLAILFSLKFIAVLVLDVTSSYFIHLIWSLFCLELLFYMRTFYSKDTNSSSLFFSIDKVRTFRFLTIYYFSIGLLLYVIAIFQAELIVIIFLILYIIAMILLNVLIFIISIPDLITGNALNDFIGLDTDLFTDFTYQFGDFWMDTFLLHGSISIVLGVLVANYLGKLLGNYVEDKKTGIVTLFFTSNLILLPIAVFYGLSHFSSFAILSDYALQKLLIFILCFVIGNFSLTYIKFSRTFETRSEDSTYDLPYIRPWRRFSYILLSCITIFMVWAILFVFTLGKLLSYYEPSNYWNISFFLDLILTIFVFIFFSISLIFIIWNFIGDYPFDEKIAEITLREQLLSGYTIDIIF